MLCFGLAAASGAAPPAPSLPFTAVHGSASIDVTGHLTTVTTANGSGAHSVLDWPSFGVPGGQAVHFAQPDAFSTSINRVTGGNPSAILGTLSSNGRLVLVNPAGITVGAGAVVDTAGFTASTLGLSRDNAIAGRLLFGSGELGDFRRSGGDLKVEGQAQVLAKNGDVVLVGGDVRTAPGTLLQAAGGDVVLAAGQAVEVTGRGLEGIRMLLRAPGDRALNLGTLRGDSVAIFAGLLHHSGLVQASSASAVGGKVLLQATDAVDVDGSIEAATAQRGGTVLVSGDTVVLKAGTVIDVSHPAGGGEILVGGGVDGRDPRLPNARDVRVAQGVLLRADATLSGNGGRVVIWSDGPLDFGGTILARGAGGGTGGPVEAVGAGGNRFEGSVDVDGDGASPVPAPGAGRGSGSRGRGSQAPLPRVPLAGQATEVRSAADGTAAETEQRMAIGSRLLAPGQDEGRVLLQPGRDDADARLLGAGPGEGKDKRSRGREGDLFLTDTQCRAGSR